jgi:nucleoside-diphosphate-sugar epimerase
MIDLYIRGGWHIIPGNGQAVGNYAFIDDVVDGHISALHYGRPAERYILGGENLTFNEIFTQINTLTGLPRLLVRIPAPAAHFFAHLELLRAKISGHYPLITPDWSRLFMLNWAFSSDKAREEIGYRITPFKQALDKTVMWLLYANGSA